ncbi:MAG: glycoside hydrolase family 5 protein [Clostridia bacterium]|nr:glycoside hydrolase family 5 protein [Clostridia bacterium]
MKSLSLFLLFALLAFSFQKTAIETVNDMGLGWNLGNTFDCFGTWKEIKTPDDQITMWGNVVPTEEMVVTIKKYGFKTVRFPVTWMYFMDESGNVNSQWMARVKQVVDWIINAGMYCILNVHHDGVSGNWLSQGTAVKNRYVTLWKQIATEFKNYDEHLILESMNEVEYKSGNDFDFKTLNTLTQAFVDAVRSTGSTNAERLLLISGMNTNLEQTCSSGYLMPTDKANKLAISIHYYLPPQFTVESDKNPWTWTDDQGVVHEITPMTTWGTEADYKEMVTNYETMKKAFVDKGIPVILGEVGVLTEEQKKKDSIREFLYAQYSFSQAYDGFMSVLWDTSKNTAGDMNFYNRETDKWYDEKIRDNFVNIAKGDYVKPTDYFVNSNSETSSNLDSDGNIQINIGSKKVNKVIFSAKISSSVQVWDVGFGVASADSTHTWFGDPVGGAEGVKQSDGTYLFTIDVSKKDFNDYVQVQEWWGNEDIELVYATVEFAGSAVTIDYNAYKAAVAKKTS